MEEIQKGLAQAQQGSDVFFLLLGAILVFAMHGGFAFLEVGTVRHKNQVNALVKILVDFAISTISYFFIGYWIAYGVTFLAGAGTISGGDYGPQGFGLVKFFFLCTFAAAVPAIVSGGIAERAKFGAQIDRHGDASSASPIRCSKARCGTATSACRTASSKPHSAPTSTTSPARSSCTRSAAGSRSPRSLRLGARLGRYDKGRSIATPPSSIPGSPWARGCCASAGSAST